tara:strand:+ start:24 stop:233 length:210 start_codon:yes stop_codon:yes gene_type:complete
VSTVLAILKTRNSYIVAWWKYILNRKRHRMGSGCGKPAATLRGEPDADGVDRNGIVRNLKGEEGTSTKI